jgi:hypothetical protein
MSCTSITSNSANPLFHLRGRSAIWPSYASPVAIAFLKIVGFDVNPRIPVSLIDRSNVPLVYCCR